MSWSIFNSGETLGFSPACARYGYTIAERYFDEGVSGFTGANRKKGALKDFIDAVNSGQIMPNSLLLVENMDRFSREEPLEVLFVMRDLQKKGIKIILLDEEKEVCLKSYDTLMPLLKSLRANVS